MPWVLTIYLPLQQLNHVLLLLIFNTPGGVQGGEQKWGAMCSGKIGKTGLQTARYSQELILWAQFLHLFLSGKVLISFKVTLFLVTSEGFIRLVENFWKNMGLIACLLPSPKITYILTFPPASLEQFLTAIWGAVSQVAILILAQIKLNSQISHYTFFIVNKLYELSIYFRY